MPSATWSRHEPLRFSLEGTLMGERTYVHATVHDDRGRHKPTSWHIIRAPLAHARTYVTLCGRTIVSDDTMSVLPAAKSCENCLRIAARNEDRA